MSSHDHGGRPANGPAPGSQRAHLGNATRRATAGAIILRPSRRGQIGVRHNLGLTIPATARRYQDSNTGGFVLLAAAPARNILIILTTRAADELMIVVGAALSGLSPGSRCGCLASATRSGKGRP